MPTNNLVPQANLKRIIQQGDAKELVQQAELLGKRFGAKGQKGNESVVTTNQIRAIFGTVRQIEMNWPGNADAGRQEKAERDLILLKPKVIYRAAREKSAEFGQFAGVIVDSIDLVLDSGAAGSSRDRFGRFVDFFEAIMAYHKAASEGVLA